MSLDPVSPEEESFDFDVPDQGPQKSKYAFAGGKYRARVTDLDKGETKPKDGADRGDPKVVITYTLLEGPGEGVDFKQHLPVLRYNPQLEGENKFEAHPAFWKLEQAATALGVPYDKASKRISLKRAELVGREVMLDMTLGEFNGKARMEIRKVLKAEQQVLGL
jgi:hypothetical protein